MSNQYVQTQVVCANCAAIRGESNHYFLVVPPSEFVRAVTIEKYDDGTPPKGGDLPACGSECLLRLVAKNLEKI